MIATLADIPIDGLEEVVNDFVSENAINLSPWPAGTLPDPTQHYPGIYLQPNGDWFVVALLPDSDGKPPLIDPGPVPSSTSEVFPTPAQDPQLTIASPSSFTIFTDLKQTVSTLTADAIDQFFAMQSAEHQSLKGIGQPVIDTARKYAINASYIVAHAILESGWGTSRISRVKNNLFGWNAFDSNPDLAKGFDSRAQCIDFVMGRVNTLYLDPRGKFFVDRPCVGNKQMGMNVNYAAESDWGANIAAIAQHMGKMVGGSTPGVLTRPAQKVRGTTAKYVVDHRIPGNVLRIPHGVLSILADDGTVIASIEANTGGFVSDFRKHNGPIPPGKYSISNYRSPRNDEGTAMRYFDVSFSFSLTPIENTDVFGRDGLDIHPDGPPPGTHGCIGLVAQTRQQLESFRDLLRAHTSGGSHLAVTVQYMPTSGVT
jgi:beta-N-acetylglucosaminidase